LVFNSAHIGSRTVEGYEEIEGESLETALFVLLPVCTVHIDISLFDQSSFLSPSFELFEGFVIDLRTRCLDSIGYLILRVYHYAPMWFSKSIIQLYNYNISSTAIFGINSKR
jgi:hypothetical protein